jgi:hypothetical protein
VRAMLRQLGVPGKANVYVVWAEPQNPDDAKEADWEVSPNAGLGTDNPNAQRTGSDGFRQFAVLLDSFAGTGWTYQGNHAQLPGGKTGPGLNRYEACLRFESDGTTKYYGGGAGVYRDKNAVIHGQGPPDPEGPTFWGMAWVEFLSDAENAPFKVIQIVKSY